VLSDEHKAQVNAASVSDALQTLAPLIFNSKAFEIKDGKATGFHALHIAEEFVSFVEPVSLDAALADVLHAVEQGMKNAVKRDIVARCQKFEISAKYEGMAEAVLIADEIHYNWHISSCGDPSELKVFDEFVYQLIDLAKEEMTPVQRLVLNSRIHIALYWLERVKRMIKSIENKEEMKVPSEQLRYHMVDGDVEIERGETKTIHGY